VNRSVSGSAIGYKTGININSPATGSNREIQAACEGAESPVPGMAGDECLGGGSPRVMGIMGIIPRVGRKETGTPANLIQVLHGIWMD
jgi:hypothetical protein